MMPRRLVETDAERWEPLVVGATHVACGIQQIRIVGGEMLVSDTCRPGPFACRALVLQEGGGLGVVVLVFRRAELVGRAAGVSFAVGESPLSAKVKGMMFAQELLHVEACTIDVVVGVRAVQGHPFLASLRFVDGLRVVAFVLHIVKIEL